MKRRVLVTGIGGFAGRHLAERLCRDGDVELHGLGTAAVGGVPCDRYFACDLTDASIVSRTIDESRPDVVYHLAARLGGTTPDRLREVNVRGFMLLCDALRRTAERRGAAVRMLALGSAAELGATGAAKLPIREDAPCEPETAYGRSKWEMTQRALREPAHGPLRIVVARTFNLVGPGLGPHLALGRFARQIVAVGRGEADCLRCGNLAGRRDFIDVRDAAAIYVALAEQGRPGELYHVCAGRSYCIGELLERMIAASGFDVRVVSETDPNRAGDLADVYGDPTKTETATGLRPTISIDDSLRDLMHSAAVSHDRMSPPHFTMETQRRRENV
jgi:GDP-4-dehydro-6-deoxy-D-mannose reductase